MLTQRLYNTGQVCCASKRFLVHEDVAEEFTKKVVEKIDTLKQGMPPEEDTQIGCLISEKAAKTVEEQIQLTVQQGGKIVLGGGRDGAFIEPTVIVDVPKTADVAIDMEIFGPGGAHHHLQDRRGGHRDRQRLGVRSVQLHLLGRPEDLREVRLRA